MDVVRVCSSNFVRLTSKCYQIFNNGRHCIEIIHFSIIGVKKENKKVHVLPMSETLLLPYVKSIHVHYYVKLLQANERTENGS